MRKAILALAAIAMLASCGAKTEEDFAQSRGKFFTISHPKEFSFNESDFGCTITGSKFGVAVTATGGNFKEGTRNLSSFADEFKKAFTNSKVEAVDYAGYPALYLESKTDKGEASFGYLFLLDGAQVTVNASMIPESEMELASRILGTFKITDPKAFASDPQAGDAEITQFGPSEGQPIQIGTVRLVPPKGWRILDNSTPDFITVEPKDEAKEDAGMGISIATVEDSPSDARKEAEAIATKLGGMPKQAVYGDLTFWMVEAEYQQKVYVYFISFGMRLHQVTISTPFDELGDKMTEFISNLAFLKQ
jgi:hypothetical protein